MLRMLFVLYRLWRRHPEYRLCQLLMNVTDFEAFDRFDIFYIEDKRLLRDLRRYG